MHVQALGRPIPSHAFEGSLACWSPPYHPPEAQDQPVHPTFLCGHHSRRGLDFASPRRKEAIVIGPPPSESKQPSILASTAAATAGARQHPIATAAAAALALLHFLPPFPDGLITCFRAIQRPQPTHNCHNGVYIRGLLTPTSFAQFTRASPARPTRFVRPPAEP